MKDTFAFQVLVLYREFLAYTKKELKALGLSFGQMPLIVYAGKHPGCMQADLTRALQLDWDIPSGVWGNWWKPDL